MRSSHKLAVRRVGNTAGYGRLREREPRVFAWNKHDIRRLIVLSRQFFVLCSPLVLVLVKENIYDQGACNRCASSPFPQEVRETFIALPNFLPLLQYLFAAPRSEKVTAKIPANDTPFSLFDHLRGLENFDAAEIRRWFSNADRFDDSRQKTGVSFAIQFSIQTWQKAEDDFERSSVFFGELARLDEPERYTRRLKASGSRGTKGAFISYCEGAQKDGGPPFRCESAFPRPSAAMETDSKVATGCERGRCRFLNPQPLIASFSSPSILPPRISNTRNFQSINRSSMLLGLVISGFRRMERENSIEISNIFELMIFLLLLFSFF